MLPAITDGDSPLETLRPDGIDSVRVPKRIIDGMSLAERQKLMVVILRLGLEAWFEPGPETYVFTRPTFPPSPGRQAEAHANRHAWLIR